MGTRIMNKESAKQILIYQRARRIKQREDRGEWQMATLASS
jgi:hypothetical protein